MTLMELLIALGLGASLSATLMQLFTAGMHLQARQSSVQDLQQRSAYTQFLLRSAIRGSASPCASVNNTVITAEYPALLVLEPRAAAIDAITGSHVLRVLTGDCGAPVEFYYIGHGMGDASISTGLFRRRQRGDGSFASAEELVEGVTAMTATVGLRLPAASPAQAGRAVAAYVDAELVDDWSQAFSVNLAVTVRQMTVAGEMGGDSLALGFSTSLRHAELHMPGRTAQ